MTVILGIDAAWTSKQPSGLAVGMLVGNRWRVVRAAASYPDFVDLPYASDAFPPLDVTLAAAQRSTGRSVGLVSVDMPLSYERITCRRLADNAVSRAYGGRKAGTHTPNPARPGQVSRELMSRLNAAGYPLLTETITLPGTIEVYPHPALIELMGAPERLPYKAAKIRKYWPELSPAARREKLITIWHEITARLAVEIDGVADVLPPIDAQATGRELKAYEDMLDAIVCVWVGICAVEGSAKPFGDSAASICEVVPLRWTVWQRS